MNTEAVEPCLVTLRTRLRAARLARIAATVLLLVGSRSPAAEAPDIVTIDLPHGQSIVFRAIFLGVDGERMFGSRRITLGSREPNPSYKQHLTETLISGSFVGTRNGRKEWLYYLGETELQEGQWNAVMTWKHPQSSDGVGRVPPKGQSEGSSKKPRTSATMAEIQQFIETLNSWMLKEQRSQLPTFRGAMAFARLPTEAEWAFAARGGIETIERDREAFDRPYPYVGALAEYEWLRSNSGNQAQECGSPFLKPNPVQLRDMLGNVKELTLSLFGPEYQQGRFGDFVIRGGDFSTRAAELSAALRTESQSHYDDGALARPTKVGFRLALGTRVSAVRATPAEFDKEFERYIQQVGLTRPGPIGASSPAVQAGEDERHYFEEQVTRLRRDNERLTAELDRLSAEKRSVKESIGRAGPSPGAQVSLGGEMPSPDDTDRKDLEIADLRRRLSLVGHELKKNAGRVREVEKRYLEALMRQASANAYLGWRGLKKLQILEKAGVPPGGQRAHRQLETESRQMIEDYWNLVVEIAEGTKPELFPEVKADLSAWLRAREGKGAAGRQRKSLDLMERHVAQVRSGRYAQPSDLFDSFVGSLELQ